MIIQLLTSASYVDATFGYSLKHNSSLLPLLRVVHPSSEDTRDQNIVRVVIR
jgi:hypothetical protein